MKEFCQMIFGLGGATLGGVVGHRLMSGVAVESGVADDSLLEYAMETFGVVGGVFLGAIITAISMPNNR